MLGFVKFLTASSVAAFVLALQLSTVHAGAWVQKKHGYFFKLSGSYLYTTQEYDNQGIIQEIREDEPGIENTSYQEVAATGYLEYGVTERLTLVSNLPFKIITSKRSEIRDPGDPFRNVEVVTGGLSDLTISGRFLIGGGTIPISLQAGAKIPMGYDASPPDQGAPLGSGKVDIEGHILAGASLYPVPAYLTGQFGYRLRSGTGIADEYLFQLELGLTPGPWLFKATLDGLYSASTPSQQGSSTTTTTNQDLLKIIPTVGFAITPRFGIGAELFYPLKGKNTVAGTTYAVGMVFSR
jgi:hypothetical protein